MRYHAFGSDRGSGGSLNTDKRFTGQTLDASTGLYWYTSRPYDPALARFTQADTIMPDPANPQSLNRYSYVLGNPLRHTDPRGHQVEAPGFAWWAYERPEPMPVPVRAPTPMPGATPAFYIATPGPGGASACGRIIARQEGGLAPPASCLMMPAAAGVRRVEMATLYTPFHKADHGCAGCDNPGQL